MPHGPRGVCGGAPRAGRFGPAEQQRQSPAAASLLVLWAALSSLLRSTPPHAAPQRLGAFLARGDRLRWPASGAGREDRQQALPLRVLPVPTRPAVPEISPLHRVLDVWNLAVDRLTCWGEGCRVVFTDGVQFVEIAAKESASATWNAMMLSEGQFIYNLFRRQLAVFIPRFDPATQIGADVFMQRSFWLRNLHMSPAAFSLLIPLVPPGLNFTSFWVSDVRVSWKNLLSLDQNPIVLDIGSVQATAAELPAGSDEEIENLITAWLDVLGGSHPVPFQGKYPLLDGATFRMRHLHLDIHSPTRYGNLSVRLEGVEVLAVDSEGRQRDLSTLCKEGLNGDCITFHRLVDCSQASVMYVNRVLEDRGLVGALGPEAAAEEGGQRFVLEPTPVAALLTQKSYVEDMRHVVGQRWTLAFPRPMRIFALPPLFSPAPELPAPDKRLCAFPAPATEWHVRCADGSPFAWQFKRFQPHRPQMHPIAAVGFTLLAVAVLLALTADLTPRPWLQRILAKVGPLRYVLW